MCVKLTGIIHYFCVVWMCAYSNCSSEQSAVAIRGTKIDKTHLKGLKMQGYAACVVVFRQTEGKGKNAFESRNVLSENCCRNNFIALSGIYASRTSPNNSNTRRKGKPIGRRKKPQATVWKCCSELVGEKKWVEA